MKRVVKILFLIFLFTASVPAMMPIRAAVDTVSLPTAQPGPATAEPDSNPTVSNIKAFHNLLETDDMLIYAETNTPYGTLPDEPASDTYILRLMNGSTELGARAPVVFFDFGYNLNATGFYFSAADAPAWEGTYTVRISQNPTYFTAPQSWDYPIAPSSYSTDDTQAGNRTELSIAVIATAGRLEAEYTSYTLLEGGVAGTILSNPTGETYFRKVVYGIQAMCPTLFLLQILTDVYTDKSYGDNMSAEYAARFDGTFVKTDATATGNQYGMSPEAIMAFIFAFPVCIGSIVVASKKFGKSEPGFVFSALVLMVMYLMGWMPPAIFASIYQVMAIYLSYVWFYARG